MCIHLPLAVPHENAGVSSHQMRSMTLKMRPIRFRPGLCPGTRWRIQPTKGSTGASWGRVVSYFLGPWVSDWVSRVLRPTRHIIGHFRDGVYRQTDKQTDRRRTIAFAHSVSEWAKNELDVLSFNNLSQISQAFKDKPSKWTKIILQHSKWN